FSVKNCGTSYSPIRLCFEYVKVAKTLFGSKYCLTYCLCQSDDNLLTCGDFCDPADDALHSIHPYLQLHASHLDDHLVLYDTPSIVSVRQTASLAPCVGRVSNVCCSSKVLLQACSHKP
uniref:Uncharacterized protein n=1 Tax=Sinocyclocheilus grahami TaxID=75366 RepID=A0A672P303_SINGR